MEEIIRWESMGFMIRDGESKEHYLGRLANVANLPLQATPEVLRQYGIDPGWVPVFYSNDNLHLWEAACAWQEGDIISIQMRAAFEKQQTYMHFYKKDEILAHEYVHAARFPLQSAKYEEFFAYYLSRFYGSHFRAFVGPFFTKPADTAVFLLLCLMPLAALFFGTNTFLLVPFFAIGFFGLRLTYTWSFFSRCMKKVGLPLMVRLTDHEIEFFAEASKPEITSWIEAQKASSFRWQVISAYYN